MVAERERHEAICVRCCVLFPVSREEYEWIENGEGIRVLCPTCWHEATGIDD
jgi:hypothetical protein